MIILISGSVNSGKSTVARILTKLVPKTAHIEVDDLRQFIRWMPLEESIPMNLDNTISITKNFLKRGLNVIITYPLSKQNYEYLLKGIGQLNKYVYTFTLNPQLSEVLNRRKRTLTRWERNRVKHHYKVGINKPEFGIVINTTNQKPEETAKIILEKTGAQTD